MPKRRAVGRNVLRKEGTTKVTGLARYIDDISFRRRPPRPDDSIDRSRRRDREHPAATSTGTGFTVVDHRDIPGRNIVALIDDDQPCLAASARSGTSPSRSCCWRTRIASGCSRPEVAHRLSRDDTGLRPGTSPTSLQDDRDRQGRLDEGLAAGGRHRRGRVPHRTSGAALHRAERRRSPCRSTAASRVYGSLQCPVLRASRADGAARSSAGRRSASCRPKPAAASAARKSIRR